MFRILNLKLFFNVLKDTSWLSSVKTFYDHLLFCLEVNKPSTENLTRISHFFYLETLYLIANHVSISFITKFSLVVA